MPMNISIRKIATDVAFPTRSEATPELADFIYNYGAVQVMNDCHAGLKRADFDSDESFKASVAKRVADKRDALVAGQFRRTATTSVAKAVAALSAEDQARVAAYIESLGKSESLVDADGEPLEAAA